MTDVNVEVWCFSKEPFCVWSGVLPALPRPGDYLIVFSGWCDEPVKEVHFDLEDEIVRVFISDATGEYKAELDRRELREREGGDA